MIISIYLRNDGMESIFLDSKLFTTVIIKQKSGAKGNLPLWLLDLKKKTLNTNFR